MFLSVIVLVCLSLVVGIDIAEENWDKMPAWTMAYLGWIYVLLTEYEKRIK